MDVLEAAACLNCGRPLTGPYCANCGQKKQATDLTLRELLHETTHELTNWDGKIPSTLKTLLIRPGVLTVDFLAGRRARWLSPLRLYLLCSLAFFVSKPIAEAISQRSLRGVARVGITNTDGSAALTSAELESIEKGLPARIFGRDRLLRAAANNAQLNREIEASLPKAMFILLPAFAGLTMLAWRRRLRRYPAHLYLALHLHSAWFGALAVLTMVEAFVTSEVGTRSHRLRDVRLHRRVCVACRAPDLRRILGANGGQSVRRRRRVRGVPGRGHVVAPGLRDYEDVTGDTQPGQSPGTLNWDSPRGHSTLSVPGTSHGPGCRRSALWLDHPDLV